MLNKVRLVAIATLSFSILFASCKKNDNNDSSNSLTEAQMQVHSNDQNQVGDAVESIANDANAAIETNAGFGGRLDGTAGTQSLICNANVVADTMSNPRTITVTYNGLNCQGNATRTGTVVFAMAQGVRWRDPNAVLTVTATNLKITRVADGKSITINGTHTLTNVSGGRLIDLPQQSPQVHTITSSNMSVKFDDNSVRAWQVARKRTFSYNNGVVLSVTGTHTDGTTNGICEWGTTRFGTPFVTSITQPLVFRQDCMGRLVSGEVEHSRFAGTARATFGLDANGNPTSCPGANPFYMKLVVTRTGQSPITVILPY